MAKNVIDLLGAVQAAYDIVQQKTSAREKAVTAAAAASQEESNAADALKALQSELNAILGKVLPASDARVRVSA